jgi:hypothetical protein
MSYPNAIALLAQADDSLEAAERWFEAAERRLAETRAVRARAVAMVEAIRDE